MFDKTKPRSRRTLPVRGLHVLVVEGTDRDRSASVQDDRLTIGTDPTNDLVLEDPTVSRFHLELRRSPSSIEVYDLASTNGTGVSSAQLKASRVTIEPGTVLEMGSTRVRVDDGPTALVGAEAGEGLGLIGRSAPMQILAERIHRVAASGVSVLVSGESGVGKELVARALHDASPRADAPFVILDCAAIPPSLAASELFGHERGAFTGADRQHIGAFERAHGGTLFLDEIGELTPELQALLLGAIERRRIRRVGGRHEIEVDVRVLAATHRDLRAAVNSGHFRLDLFHLRASRRARALHHFACRCPAEPHGGRSRRRVRARRRGFQEGRIRASPASLPECRSTGAAPGSSLQRSHLLREARPHPRRTRSLPRARRGPRSRGGEP